ncbi:hypothetical protein IR083_10245 [Dysgonomonas sp. GY75]|uniref:hypothetical protein n=1 Tax=Dysgonomonas sp. GY75 TaxID=2780419 RepID=UPI0018831246|nr:hypothetical protein [Dysgonomonas sp. GY75]MBF0649201.1 hypothetical protein [Dysgonomonas sp. GY75]
MTKFTTRNDQIVRLKNPAFFDKDLELFKKTFRTHPLFNQLANVNQFNKAKLDCLMVTVLLDEVTEEEILENRTQEKQPEPEPKTIESIRDLLIEKFELDQADIEALSEIIPLWLDKTDEEIISAVKKLLGYKTNQGENTGSEDPGTDDTDATGKQQDITRTVTGTGTASGDNNQDEGSGIGNGATGNPAPAGTTSTQPVERDNSKTFIRRINEAETIEAVEAILKEDREGGERITVQQAGQKRIEILKQAFKEPDPGKKKD